MASKTRAKKIAVQRRRQLVRWSVAVLLALLLGGAYVFLFPNTGSFSDGEYLYIRTGSDYDDVKNALKGGGFVRDLATFDLLAKQAGYPSRIHPGKYRIPKDAGNFQLVRLLRSGRQTPVKLVIGRLRTEDDFVRLLSRNLEVDSAVARRLFADPVYLAQFGLAPRSGVLCGVLPDTYEFWWNTGPDKAFRKILKTSDAFWTADRLKDLQALNLTRCEAVTVASIVEEETNNNSEKPLIASVYLNRYRQGMKLQADPTARYAAGDFTIRRVTSAQTGVVSDYNTYQVTGLPPGPICTPSRSSINAVLQAPKTDYLYFCAKEDFSGTHRFAATYAEHQRNARLFQAALNARNIH